MTDHNEIDHPRSTATGEFVAKTQSAPDLAPFVAPDDAAVAATQDAVTKAQEQVQAAQDTYYFAIANHVGTTLLAKYPNAVTLELAESDQGGATWWANELLDENGDTITDQDDYVGDDVDHLLGDLPARKPYFVAQNDDGEWERADDPAWDWFDQTDPAYAKIDLRKAVCAAQ